MLKCSLFIFWLLLATSFAQVTYSSTPTQEDLGGYFFDGLKIVTVDVAEDATLHYQFVGARTMSALASNDYELEQAATYGKPVGDTRFIMSFNIDGDFVCGRTTEGPKTSVLAVGVQVAYLNPNGSRTDISGGGGIRSCVEFNPNFNLGHWADFLGSRTDSLPSGEWVPVSAFIPNYYDGTLRYASATEWFVLLVMIDDGATLEQLLSQDKLVQRIRDYGINPNP